MITKCHGRVLVLGFGQSGAAAARLLMKHGWSVTVLDERDALSDTPEAGRSDAGSLTTARDIDAVDLSACDAAIVSPGIPHEHRWLLALRERSLPIIPEFELGLSYLTGTQVIAVTGSNGKSSFVKWLADALTVAGHTAVPAGNYGLPPSEIALKDDTPEFMVLELSSFQLEQSIAFRAPFNVLLNLSPNHLDRHASYDAYVRAKARLFRFAKPGDEAWVHAPAMEDIASVLPEHVQPLLFDEGTGHAAGYRDGWVYLNGERTVSFSGTWWGAYPQAVNASPGVSILKKLGLSNDVIRSSLESFIPLPHRFEKFVEFDGVSFVDDSKASTMSALQAAVNSGEAKKHLIAGGILKENDVSFVKEILVEKCAFVYCIGTVAEKLVDAWSDRVPCENCGDLETAVEMGFTNAKPGEVVLLSPGCSSFDQFTSYAQRGVKFKELVHERISRNRVMK